MNRRGFLKSMLIAGTAPAIVRADSLMRIIPCETEIITSSFYTTTNGLLWPGIHAWWLKHYSEDGCVWYRKLVETAEEWKPIGHDLLTGEDR